MPENCREAACTIRAYLSELLDSESAQSMDAQLADLLNQSEQNVDNQILEILCSTEKTRQWTERFLESETLAEFKAYQLIPGNPTQPIPGMIKYSCPHGDFIYYQRQEGEEIPLCKTHNIPLERV